MASRKQTIEQHVDCNLEAADSSRHEYQYSPEEQSQWYEGDAYLVNLQDSMLADGYVSGDIEIALNDYCAKAEAMGIRFANDLLEN